MNSKLENKEILDEVNEEQKKVEKKKMKLRTKIIIIICSILVFFMGIGLFLLYGPWDGFRNFWITSAMTTMNHRYLAEWFYSDETIQKVLNKNNVIESGDSTNPDLITIEKYTGDSNIYKNEYEKEILTNKDNDLYKVINISGKSYQGYLVAIYKPEKISIATSKYLGTRGEAITTVAKRENAVIAMNASGFYDPDWNSNGALPHGTVIKNGKIVSDYEDANVGGGFIGFTNDNKFVLSKNLTAQQAIEKGYRDAIEFGPFLIVNGKSSFVSGNGGWGIAPRTAIGQRKDGIVLFLVINGRIPSSIGADMSDLCEILQNYGAYNAANLDGGSSTELVINNKIINRPVAGGTNGLRDMPTFWVVKE